MRISTEVENVRKYQTETTDLKNIVMKLKNTIEGLNIWLHEAEEKISELKYSNGTYPIRATKRNKNLKKVKIA